MNNLLNHVLKICLGLFISMPMAISMGKVSKALTMQYDVQNSLYEVIKVIIDKNKTTTDLEKIINDKRGRLDVKTFINTLAQQLNYEDSNDYELGLKGLPTKKPPKIAYTTLLHHALAQGSLDTVKKLLDMGANPNILNSDKYSPLHATIRSINIPALAYMLLHGADLQSVEDFSGLTTLELALLVSNDLVITTIMRSGIYKTAYATTKPLELFLVEKAIRERKSLEDIIAMIKTHRGTLQAATFVNLPLTRFLVPRDKKPQQYHITLFQVAVMNDDVDLCEALVKMGADIETQDSFGVSPLHLAVKNNKLAVVNFLIKNKADIFKKDPTTGLSALGIAEQINSIPLIVAIFSSKLCTGSKDPHGRLALEHATQETIDFINGIMRHLDFYSMLAHLPENTDLATIDNCPVTTDGNTPLHTAVMLGRDDLIDLVYLQDPSSLDQLNFYGETPLLIATLNAISHFREHDYYTAEQYLKVIKKLVSNMPDIIDKITEHEGKRYTSLGLACEAQYEDLIRLLLLLGANPNTEIITEHNDNFLPIMLISDQHCERVFNDSAAMGQQLQKLFADSSLTSLTIQVAERKEASAICIGINALHQQAKNIATVSTTQRIDTTLKDESEQRKNMIAQENSERASITQIADFDTQEKQLIALAQEEKNHEYEKATDTQQRLHNEFQTTIATKKRLQQQKDIFKQEHAAQGLIFSEQDVTRNALKAQEKLEAIQAKEKETRRKTRNLEKTAFTKIQTSFKKSQKDAEAQTLARLKQANTRDKKQVRKTFKSDEKSQRKDINDSAEQEFNDMLDSIKRLNATATLQTKETQERQAIESAHQKEITDINHQTERAAFEVAETQARINAISAMSRELRASAQKTLHQCAQRTEFLRRDQQERLEAQERTQLEADAQLSIKQAIQHERDRRALEDALLTEARSDKQAVLDAFEKEKSTLLKNLCATQAFNPINEFIEKNDLVGLRAFLFDPATNKPRLSAKTLVNANTYKYESPLAWVMAKNSILKNPLFTAIEAGNDTALQILLECGIESNQKLNGKTAVEFADQLLKENKIAWGTHSTITDLLQQNKTR